MLNKAKNTPEGNVSDLCFIVRTDQEQTKNDGLNTRRLLLSCC